MLRCAQFSDYATHTHTAVAAISKMPPLLRRSVFVSIGRPFGEVPGAQIGYDRYRTSNWVGVMVEVVGGACWAAVGVCGSGWGRGMRSGRAREYPAGSRYRDQCPARCELVIQIATHATDQPNVAEK